MDPRVASGGIDELRGNVRAHDPLDRVAASARPADEPQRPALDVQPPLPRRTDARHAADERAVDAHDRDAGTTLTDHNTRRRARPASPRRRAARSLSCESIDVSAEKEVKVALSEKRLSYRTVHLGFGVFVGSHAAVAHKDHARLAVRIDYRDASDAGSGAQRTVTALTRLAHAQSRSPRDGRRWYASRARASAELAAYRSTMLRVRHPARRIRSPSLPSFESHECANVCRSW